MARTLAADAVFEGAGLFSGIPCRLRVRPATAGSGIVFVRTDLPDRPAIPARTECVAPASRRTTLARGGASISTVEHLLAACHAEGLTDLAIEAGAAEIPHLDGSCLPFVAGLRAAGYTDLPGPAQTVAPRGPVTLTDEDGATITCSPGDGCLDIEFLLAYDASPIGRQRVSGRLTPEWFRSEIAPARTFCLEREARALRAAGEGLGGDTGTVVVVGEEGVMDTELRFPDECVRHKVADLIGDLALVGARIDARIRASRSGHALNRRLATILAAGVGVTP